MTFSEWIKSGIEEGYCSKVACAIHDGIPDDDPLEELCIHIVRLYEPKQKRNPAQ